MSWAVAGEQLNTVATSLMEGGLPSVSILSQTRDSTVIVVSICLSFPVWLTKVEARVGATI
jgi:hypothetical protein